MSSYRLLFLASAALIGAYACTLDFGKWEGTAPGGMGGTTVQGGGGQGAQGATGAQGGDGGDGGDGGIGGQGGALPANCTNMVKDANETDVDCGGDCLGCANDLDCLVFDDCASLFCNAGTCAACTTDPNCADATDTWCDTATAGGTCVAKKAQAVSCVGDNECLSASCEDNVCCDVACDGNCEACVANKTVGGVTGECSPIIGTTDPDNDCTVPGQVCNGINACVALCGLEPTPPGGACPGVCNGGCAAGVCTINCAGAAACPACPDGFDCQVNCLTNGACQNATIECPEFYACNVTCNAVNGCRTATVNCATSGSCAVGCLGGSNVCLATQVNCGTNNCAVVCDGTDLPLVNNCPNGCATCDTCP